MLTALTKKELGIDCKEATKRELIILNEINDLDYCLDMIEKVVNNTILPQENKYCDEIKELQHKCELLESENKHLKEINTQINDKNEILKETMRDLRKRHP